MGHRPKGLTLSHSRMDSKNPCMILISAVNISTSPFLIEVEIGKGLMLGSSVTVINSPCITYFSKIAIKKAGYIG